MNLNDDDKEAFITMLLGAKVMAVIISLFLVLSYFDLIQ